MADRVDRVLMVLFFLLFGLTLLLWADRIRLKNELAKSRRPVYVSVKAKQLPKTRERK